MKQIKQNLIAILAGLTVFSGIAFAAITSPIYQDENAEIVDVNVINEAGVVHVCKDRCRYTTIQSAVDSFSGLSSENRGTVQISPGLYEENVVLPSWITLLGKGGGEEVIIRGTTGATVTLGADGDNLSFITVQSRPTASGATAINAPNGGEHIIFTCWVNTESSTNDITASVVSISSNSILTISETIGSYIMLGSAGGARTHNIIDLQGSSDLVYTRSEITGAGVDVDDEFNLFNINTTGDVIPANILNAFQHLNPAFTGTVNLFKHTKDTGNKFDGQNLLQLIGSGGGTGNVFYVDSDTDNATIVSNRNTIFVLGFNNNYFANVGTGDTLNSDADSITASEGTTGAGIVNFANTQEYAGMRITGGGVFQIDAISEWHAFPSFIAGLISDNMHVEPGISGTIDAIADNGSGYLRITDTDHGLTTGDYITTTGSGDPLHNDITRVTVIDGNTFDCDDILYNSANNGGFWNRGSYIQADRRGAYNISYTISVSSSAANQIVEFAAFNGITEVPGTKIERKFGVAGDVGSVAGSGIVFLEKGDKLWFGLQNNTSVSDITISEGAFNSSKTS